MSSNNTQNSTFLVKSFMPGTIKDIFVKEGEEVKKGDKLLVLDAMKMDNEICSPVHGTVSRICVKSNTHVAKDVILVEVTKA